MKPIKTRLFATADAAALGELVAALVVPKCDGCPHMVACDPDVPEPPECADCDVELGEPSRYGDLR